MPLARRDHTHHTYSDYRAWPEDTRYELIEGSAYAMAPAPSRTHQDVLGQVFRQIADALEGSTCGAFVAPFEVRLPRTDEADDAIKTVVQPDITVVCDSAKLDDRGCRGAPDWVIEILSPATAGHDQIVKRDVYERHGVREYWLVHPTDRVVTVYRLAEGAYGKPDVHELAGSLACATLPQVAVDWARVLREPA